MLFYITSLICVNVLEGKQEPKVQIFYFFFKVQILKKKYPFKESCNTNNKISKIEQFTMSSGSGILMPWKN